MLVLENPLADDQLRPEAREVVVHTAAMPVSTGRPVLSDFSGLATTEEDTPQATQGKRALEYLLLLLAVLFISYFILRRFMALRAQNQPLRRFFRRLSSTSLSQYSTHNSPRPSRCPRAAPFAYSNISPVASSPDPLSPAAASPLIQHIPHPLDAHLTSPPSLYYPTVTHPFQFCHRHPTHYHSPEQTHGFDIDAYGRRRPLAMPPHTCCNYDPDKEALPKYERHGGPPRYNEIVDLLLPQTPVPATIAGGATTSTSTSTDTSVPVLPRFAGAGEDDVPLGRLQATLGSARDGCNVRGWRECRDTRARDGDGLSGSREPEGDCARRTQHPPSPALPPAESLDRAEA